MIAVKFKGLDEAIADLHRFRQKAIPHAARNGLTSAAFEARRIWQGEIKRSFTLRNQFTERSIRVEKARGLDTKRMVAVVGSVAPYMHDQEFGASVRGRSGKKAIPGPVAAGQAPGAKRTRTVRMGRRLSAIKVSRFRGSKKQQNAIAIAMARKHGNKAALLHRPKGGKGLFLIGGGKRKATVKLLYDVSKGSVRVKPVPTLGRTMHRMNARMPAIMRKSVVEQLRYHKVFGY